MNRFPERLNPEEEPHVTMWREQYGDDVLRYLESYGVHATVSFEHMTERLKDKDSSDPLRRQQIAALASTQVLRTIAQGDNPADLAGAKDFFDKLGVSFALSETTRQQLRELHGIFHDARDHELTGFFKEGETRADVDRRILTDAGYDTTATEYLLPAIRLYRGIALPLRNPNEPEGIAFGRHVLPLFGGTEQNILNANMDQLAPGGDTTDQ